MRIRIAIVFLIAIIPLLAVGQVYKTHNKINVENITKNFKDLDDIEIIDTLNKIALSIAKDKPDSCRKLATITITAGKIA